MSHVAPQRSTIAKTLAGMCLAWYGNHVEVRRSWDRGVKCMMVGAEVRERKTDQMVKVSGFLWGSVI